MLVAVVAVVAAGAVAVGVEEEAGSTVAVVAGVVVAALVAAEVALGEEVVRTAEPVAVGKAPAADADTLVRRGRVAAAAGKLEVLDRSSEAAAAVHIPDLLRNMLAAAGAAAAVVDPACIHNAQREEEEEEQSHLAGADAADNLAAAAGEVQAAVNTVADEAQEEQQVAMRPHSLQQGHLARTPQSDLLSLQSAVQPRPAMPSTRSS